MIKVEIKETYCCALNPTGGIFELGETNPNNSNCVKITSEAGKRSGWIDKALIKELHYSVFVRECTDCGVEVNNKYAFEYDFEEFKCLPCDLKARYGKEIGDKMLTMLFEANKKEQLAKGIKYM